MTEPRRIRRHCLGLASIAAALLTSCLIDERLYDPELPNPALTAGAGGSAGMASAGDGVLNGGGNSAGMPLSSAAPDASTPCSEYCGTLSSICGEQAPFDSPSCLATCPFYAEGEAPTDLQNTDTLTCRRELLNFTDEEDLPLACQAAVPGGTQTDDLRCGTRCEAYCNLQQVVCAQGALPDYSVVSCLQQCEMLPDLNVLVPETQRIGTDSLQCRLLQLTEIAKNPQLIESNCRQTHPNPYVSSKALQEGNWPDCASPPDQAPSCSSFCELVMQTCTADNQVYTDTAECLAVCNALPKGTTADIGSVTDTLEATAGCRQYHAYNALARPEDHCTHAGPTGDGHCTADNCFGYCQLALAGCPTQYVEQFPLDSDDITLGQCVESCQQVPNSERDGFKLAPSYNPALGAAAMAGNHLQCRTFHAVQALAAPNDAVQCAAAFGAGDCAAP